MQRLRFFGTECGMHAKCSYHLLPNSLDRQLLLEKRRCFFPFSFISSFNRLHLSSPQNGQFWKSFQRKYRVTFKEWPPYSVGKSTFFEVYHTSWISLHQTNLFWSRLNFQKLIWGRFTLKKQSKSAKNDLILVL